MKPTLGIKPRRMRALMHVFASVLALLSMTSCRIAVDHVRVRDPRRVKLVSRWGKERIAPGSGPKTVAFRLEDSSASPPRPCHAEAKRERTGALRAQCAEYPKQRVFRGEPGLLVTADGTVRPTARKTTIGDVDITVPELLGEWSKEDLLVNLVTPRDNVIEVRRRHTPLRALGWILAPGSLVPFGIGMIALQPTNVSTTSVLAASPFFALGSATLAVGLWYLLAPIRDEVIFPR